MFLSEPISPVNRLGAGTRRRQESPPQHRVRRDQIRWPFCHCVSRACPILHWGDIDAGGVKIAYRLEHALRGIDRKLSLHLMAPEIALTLGQPVKPESIFKLQLVPSSRVYPLQVFLASDDAASLEQEELDPAVRMP